MERAKDDRKKSETGDKSKGKPKVTHPLIDAAAQCCILWLSVQDARNADMLLRQTLKACVSTPPDTSSWCRRRRANGQVVVTRTSL